MNKQEKLHYNALNKLYEGDYAKLKKLLEEYGSFENAWRKEGSKECPALNPEKEWRELEKRNIDLILEDDERFPYSLKQIPFVPFGIYVLGSLEIPEATAAIVGTRAATPRGKETAKEFGRRLGEAGIAIISGLALGIDAAAHTGALAGNGKTIAVLGTPLNHIYPRQNAGLADEILQSGGAIISEYPLSHKYLPQNFLIRNRIISGLARATLVIEAPEKSGALATARFALEQDRDIFVVPGGIESKNYRGSNDLIKAGAALANRPEDMLNYFGMKDPESRRDLALSGGEEKIALALKKEGEPLSADQLSEIIGKNIQDLNANLAVLTVKGIIKEINGKYSL